MNNIYIHMYYNNKNITNVNGNKTKLLTLS